MAEPTNAKELESQLGFFGYYRLFIENYSQICTPLSNSLALAKKDPAARFQLDDSCRSARTDLKLRLSKAVMRSHAYISSEVQFILYCDACKLGYDGALHIVPASKGDHWVKADEKPICFVSRKLKKNELNYWPTELETGGLVWCLEKLGHLIEGRKLTIFTDHSALTWLFNATAAKTKANQRLTLWALSLQKWKHDARIIHRAGRSHNNADVLSRFPVATEFPSNLREDASNFLPADALRVNKISIVSTEVGVSQDYKQLLLDSYSSDQHFGGLYRTMVEKSLNNYQSFSIDKGLLWFTDGSRTPRLAIPNACHRVLFEANHDKRGHQGFSKTYESLARFYIPRLAKRLKGYIRACPKCEVTRAKDRRAGLLNPISSPATPFHTIAMDFVVSLPANAAEEEYDSILSITDKFTKCVTLIACFTTDSAHQVAERFYSHFVCRYGLPSAIISDRDVKFTSAFWKALFERMGTKLLMSTSFHPQTDGLSERSNQTVENILRTLVGYGVSENWQSKLPDVEFFINTSQHATTGHSPFHTLYGYEPRTVSDVVAGPLENEFSISFVEQRKIIRQEVSDAIHDSHATMARFYDSGRHDTCFEIGDMVCVEARPNLKIPGLDRSKVGPRRFGPFRVIKHVGSTAYKLELPPSYKMYDVINLQHLTKRSPDDYQRDDLRPPPEVIEGDENVGEYEIEAVVDSRTRRGKTQYLVKFLGYPITDSLWYDEADSKSFSQARDEYLARMSSGAIRRDPTKRRSSRKRIPPRQ